MTWEQASWIATAFSMPAAVVTLIIAAVQISSASKAYCLQWVYRYIEERRNLEEKFYLAAKAEDKDLCLHRFIELLNFLEATCLAYNLDLIPGRARPVIFKDLCHAFAAISDGTYADEFAEQSRYENVFEQTKSFMRVNQHQIKACSKMFAPTLA